ncbi:MAG: LamG domain-containing protein, partial [Sedimentisphaerales bacterium]|nr:LamG domain-containing protein [Sedimentisphaerales bacterium]
GEWPGNVWAFTTAEFGDIDNFESYTNESPDRVFQTWIDGWGFSPDDNFPNGDPGNGSGALVGYDPSIGNIMETAIVHSGAQSMPVEYNNVNSPYYSETERTWTSPQNWTTNGATDLGLWFHGSPAAMMETATGITLSGAGADIYMGTSEFRFAYKKLSGDGSITVRVDSAQTQSDWTKVGLMIRESLDPLAIQVHMISAPRQSLLEWMYRSTTNSTTTTAFNTTAGANPLPLWLRLTRAGSVFTGETSTNGTTWTKITGTDVTSSATITMPTSVYVGMIVCSQSAGNLAVGDFSQIKTTGNVTGNWVATDVGVAQAANTPDQLYVRIVDSTNKSVTVKHPDGVNAVLVNDWTQWKIPLSQLASVNTKSVKKMVIGLGDQSNPKPGGAGMLFIDDVQYGRPIQPIGLVAHYELAGDTLDSSGNGHDGVLAGNAAFPVSYVNGPTGLGQAMLFDGTQGHQYVDIGTFNPSARTGKLSVALWAKWDGLSGAWQGLIGKRTDTWDRTQMMWQIEANQTEGSLRFQREGLDVVLQSTAPAIGQWVHIAVTFDGATAKGYINGARTVEAPFSFGTGRDAPIQFGADTFGGGNSYNGTLDEIRMYDLVLTDAEVAALAGL